MIPDPKSGARLRAFAILMVAIEIVVACSHHHDGAPRAAHRIVAIGGPVTETAFALGAGDRVVAVDTSSVFPDAATKLPQVGYQRTLSAEAILAQSPDLVIASADAGPPAAIDQLRAAGVQVAVMPQALSPDEAARRIEAVGAALRVERDAQTLAEALRRDTSAARQRCSSAGHPSPRAVVVYARGAGTLLIAGEGTSGAAMLELACAHNAATGFTGYKPLSAEALIAAAPDAIVIPSRGLDTIGGEAGLLALPGVADTPAGRTHRIVAIDDLLLLGFGPRLATAIDQLAAGLATGFASR